MEHESSRGHNLLADSSVLLNDMLCFLVQVIDIRVVCPRVRSLPARLLLFLDDDNKIGRKKGREKEIFLQQASKVPL